MEFSKKWDRRYHFSNITLLNLDGEFKNFDVVGPSVKGREKLLRLVKFEFEGWVVNSRPGQANRNSPKNEGLQKGAYCRYQILNEPPGTHCEPAILNAVPTSNAGLSIGAQVHVRTQGLCRNFPLSEGKLPMAPCAGFKLPRIGVGFVEGELPLWRSYITYLAVCIVESEHPFSRNNTLCATACPWFKILEVVGANCKEHLTFSDLRLLLHEEHGASHLYPSFVRDAQTVTSIIAKARRLEVIKKTPLGQAVPLCPPPEFFKFNGSDLWSSAYIMSEGVVRTFYDKHMLQNSWTKCKSNRALIRIFPFDFWNLLNNPLSESVLAEVSEKMSDPFEGMKLSIDPEDARRLLLACTKDVATVSSNPLRAFSHLHLPDDFKRHRDFYIFGVVEPLCREGSTVKVLTKHSLLGRRNPQREMNKPLDPKRLHASICALERASLLRRLSSFSAQCTCSDPDSLRDLYSPAKQYSRAESIVMNGLRLEETGRSEIRCTLRCERIAKYLSRLNKRGRYEFTKVRRVSSTGVLYARQPQPCELNVEQSEALLSALIFSTVSVVGLAGTGKTLVAEALFEFFLIELPRSQTELAAGGGDDDDDDEDFEQFLRDDDVVLAVTHGGCMAESLRDRNVGKAQTIHSCLKRVAENQSDLTISPKSAFEGKDRLGFQIEKVKFLMIDEFSNVSDALASDLLSSSVFPNLETVVHFFDPIQTGPIEQGSLAIDYLQTFPKAADRLKQRTVEMAKIVTKCSFASELEKLTDRAKSLGTFETLSLEELKLLCPFSYSAVIYASLMSAMSIENSHNQGSQASFGVTVCLKNKLRFEGTSLVASNCAKIIRGKGFVELDYESSDVSLFKHYECHSACSLPALEFLQTMLTQVCGTVTNPVLIQAAGSLPVALLNLIFNEVRRDWLDAKSGASRDTLGRERWFALCFTNEDCKEINELCQFVCEGLQNVEEAKDSGSPALTFSKSSIEPLLSVGNKLLFREKCQPSLKDWQGMAPNWTDLGGFMKFLETFYSNLVFHDVCRAKKSDYLDKRVMGLPASKACWDELDVYAANIYADAGATDSPGPTGDLFLNIGDPRIFFTECLHSDSTEASKMEKELRKHANSVIPNFSTAYNGTRLILRGIVEWRGNFSDRVSAVAQSLAKKQDDLVRLMVSSLQKVPKGKGSAKARQLIRRVHLAYYFMLFRPSTVVQLICESLSNSWFHPRNGSDDEENGRDDPLEACAEHFDTLERHTKERSLLHERAVRKLVLLSTEGKLFLLPRYADYPGTLSSGWAVTVNYSQGRECDSAVLIVPGKEGPDAGRSNKYSLFDRTHANVAISRAPKFSYFGPRFLLNEIASKHNDSLSQRSSAVYFLLKSLNPNKKM